MIHTILFDLDDTLLDFHAAEQAAITLTLRAAGVEPAPEIIRRYSEINAGQWRLLEQGQISRATLTVRRFEILFGELSLARDCRQTQAVYEQQLSRQAQLLPRARALLDALAPHYALYAASNGSAVVQDSRLEISGLLPYFRDVFISQRMGYDKPQRQFFEQCFARIPGFCRGQTLLVGDSLSSDIAGGRQAGIRTCWFNPHHRQPGTAAPDYTIASLDELPGLLQTM